MENATPEQVKATLQSRYNNGRIDVDDLLRGLSRVDTYASITGRTRASRLARARLDEEVLAIQAPHPLGSPETEKPKKSLPRSGQVFDNTTLKTHGSNWKGGDDQDDDERDKPTT